MTTINAVELPQLMFEVGLISKLLVELSKIKSRPLVPGVEYIKHP